MSADMDHEPRHDLDPADWTAFRAESHRILDDLVTYLMTLRDRPVWQPPTSEAKAAFATPIPREGQDLDAVLETVRASVLPFATGNLHPSFMGWVQGAGTPVGMLGEMIAAALDMNCGGRNHIGHDVEGAITRWMAEALGFPNPDACSGIFVTGSSIANFMGLVVAKVAALGPETRRTGLAAAPVELTAYASAEAHTCIAQAMELSGLGTERLRLIPVDAAGAMDVAALEAAVAADRAAGRHPFFLVGSAGTVNIGAIDPLARLAEVARREALWFHVDGAIGALAALSSELRPLLDGIEAGHSVALDFHKWGHVPYDAGFLLVRDAAAHKRAFASPAAYLARADRGMSAGDTWPADLGPDLSRGFRALKTWITLSNLGTDRIGAAMAENCRTARYLAEGIARSNTFVLKAPVALNIVCFGLAGTGNKSAQNRDIVVTLQEQGTAAPSWTTLHGETVIRCAIVNHRTTRADIDRFLRDLEACAATGGKSPMDVPGTR